MVEEILMRAGFLVSTTLMGFVAGRCLTLNPREISALLVYVISPLVIFVSILQTPDPGQYLIYSIFAYLAACIAACCAWGIGRLIFHDNTANLFAFTAGTGNTGYFGLPLVMALFDETGVALAAFVILGLSLYEFSYGYYITSRGQHSVKESLQKIMRLPMLYAAALALFLKKLGWMPADAILSDLHRFTGAYSVLGMLVIGITLSQFRKFSVDWRFFCLSLSWKHLVWPLAILLLSSVAHLPASSKMVLLLMACVPMAGNTVVMANELGIHPEKAAFTTMASTVLAMFSLPLSLTLLERMG